MKIFDFLSLHQAGFALFIVSHSCFADNVIFGTEFLSDDAKQVNLARFESGKQLPGMYFVEVYVNGKVNSKKDMLFVDYASSPTGLTPCFSRNELLKFNLNQNAASKLKPINEGSECIDINSIDGSSVNYVFNEQRVLISIPDIYMTDTLNGIAPRDMWDNGINALLLNYSLNASNAKSKNHQESYYSGFFDARLNIGEWRVKNASTYQKSKELDKVEVRETYLETDLDAIDSYLRIGEIQTNSLIFSSLPITGVGLTSAEDMRPHSERYFTPIVKGVARTQATVEVRQNGYLIYQKEVSPGPFWISDVPANTSGGTLDVSVIESDGERRFTSLPYSSPALHISTGRLNYDFSVGRLNPSSSNIKKTNLSQASLIYGLPWDVSVYGGAQLSKEYKSISSGVGASIGYIGGISSDVMSSSSIINDREVDGAIFRIKYDKTIEETGTSLSLGFDHSLTGDYYTAGDILNRIESGVFESSSIRSRRLVSLSQNIMQRSSLQLQFNDENYHWGRRSAIGTVFSSSVFDNVTYSLSWLKTTDSTNNNEDSFLLSVRVPLGSMLGYKAYSTIEHSYSKNNENETRLSVDAYSYDQRSTLRASKSMAEKEGSNNESFLSASQGFNFGDLNVLYSAGDHTDKVNVGFRGGVLAHSEGVTAARYTPGAAALIDASGAEGITVHNSQAVTDGHGFAVSNMLTPYQENTVELTPPGVFTDSELLQTSTTVVPRKDSIVRAKFRANGGKKALITLRDPNGEQVPFGSLATDESNNAIGIVGEGGVLYASGLGLEGTISALWGRSGEYVCHAKYILPKERSKSGLYEVSLICN
ncbi:MAG: fimbria/pilus outer membrane usher protein [Aeromonas veronii]